MQIQVQRLRETLELLGPTVPKKPAIKALEDILLKDGKAMATDLEVAVALDLPEVEGECMVPFRPAADLLKRIPWNEMLDIEQQDKRLSLSWSGGKASYETHEPDDYPPLPQVETMAQDVDGDTLVPALLSVADYCATDTTRPVLTGVAFTPGEDTVELAAGDGFRMAYRVLPIYFTAEGISAVVIPAASVRILRRLWDKTPRPSPMADTLIGLLTARRSLELTLGDGMLRARFGPVTMTSKLIQGSPPNFRQLIPEEPPLMVDVMAPDLERAVRGVQMVARDGSGIVRLTWNEDTMTVSARSEDKGEGETTVPVRASGGPGRTALNVSYLLGYFAGRQGLVTMGVKSEKEPVLFTHGISPLVVMMPMFVQW